jgi:hypothetical protein
VFILSPILCAQENVGLMDGKVPKQWGFVGCMWKFLLHAWLAAKFYSKRLCRFWIDWLFYHLGFQKNYCGFLTSQSVVEQQHSTAHTGEHCVGCGLIAVCYTLSIQYQSFPVWKVVCTAKISDRAHIELTRSRQG